MKTETNTEVGIFLNKKNTENTDNRIELNWIEFNTFKRRRLQIDQPRHTTNK